MLARLNNKKAYYIIIILKKKVNTNNGYIIIDPRFNKYNIYFLSSITISNSDI